MAENKGGRPTDYRPEYCELLLEHMAKGYSMESFAAVVDVDKGTLYDWMKANAPFHHAAMRGKEKSRLYWERKSMEHMEGIQNLSPEMLEAAERIGAWPSAPAFNANHWKFNMINRFRDEWVDRTSNEISGPNGGPIPVETTPQQFKEMLKDDDSIKALETIIKKLGNK